MFQDILLQHLGIAQGDTILRLFRGPVGYQVKACDIIAASWAGDVQVNHGIAELLCQHLATVQETCILVQEHRPTTSYLRARFLVADKAIQHFLPLFAQAQHPPKHLLLLYQHAPALAANSVHQVIHPLVLQPPIDIRLQHAVRRKMLVKIRHPLPVPHVRQHPDDCPMLRYQLFHLLFFLEDHALSHLLCRSRVPMHYLHYHICKRVIKLLGYLLPLCLRLVRERQP